MEYMRNIHKILVWKTWREVVIHCCENLKHLKGRDRSEDLVVDGKIISEWILGK
jgi:hypothetical protein